MLELHVTDADLDPNGAPFTFDIIAGNQDNEFRVTNDGTVATTTRFDRDVKDAYRLVIRVFDAGEPPLHSDTTVDVKIIEESAFAPTVTSLAASVTTGDAQYCDGVIGQVAASDADRYDILTYDIVSYGGRDYFSVRRQSGEIRVADCIDPGQYSINVSVTDGKFVAYGEVDLEVIGIDADFASEAVVLRFKNLTPDEFVLQHRDDDVRRALATALQVTQDSVHLLTVQPSSDDIRGVDNDNDNNNNADKQRQRRRRAIEDNIDVLVAVTNDDGDDDEVWRRHALQRAIKRAKSDIESDTSLKIVSVIDDVCPNNACVNGGCVTVAYFSNDDVIRIATDSESYVSARHELGYECRCVAGFGGEIVLFGFDPLPLHVQDSTCK